MTPMAEAAAATREMFVSLVAAGFSEGQACQIIGSLLAISMGVNRGEERT